VNAPARFGLACCLSEHERLQRVAAVQPGLISFAGGLPDPELFPKRELAGAFVQVLELPGSPALQYGWPEGHVGLRHDVARRLAQRGAELDPGRVIITSGAQQAIALAARACLGVGARVGVEERCYPGALDVFGALGAELTTLAAHADAYYVMPSVSNPLGQTMASAQRRQLLQRALHQRAWLLEDDAYAETVFDGGVPRPLCADAPERAFHIGTFSKVLCPGLRIGWLVPPRALFGRCLQLKQGSDLQANSLTQLILQRYLAAGGFDSHLERARRHYRRRARLLAGALRRYLPELRFREPLGGFSIWAESELMVDDDALLDAAVEQGVSFDAGRAFRWDADPRLSFRLSFSCVAEPDIERGVLRLARALLQCRRSIRLARPA
jgi:2-aminoadipate transaminase